MFKRNLKTAICFLMVIFILWSAMPVKAEEDKLSSSLLSEEALTVIDDEVDDPQGMRLEEVLIGKVGADNYNIMYGVGIVEDGDTEFIALDSGIYSVNEEKILLSEDNAENLNISGDFLYYSLSDNDSIIRAVNKNSGELVFERTFDDYIINQMYVINDESFLILSKGNLYLVGLHDDRSEQLTFDGEIINFAPTPYGIIYSKGAVLDYTLYINGKLIDSHVNEYWIQNGTIITKKHGEEERRLIDRYELRSENEVCSVGTDDSNVISNDWETVSYDDFMPILDNTNTTIQSYSKTF